MPPEPIFVEEHANHYPLLVPHSLEMKTGLEQRHLYSLDS